jgi:pimeloyl-ACP methyl ester carboxylesterase
VVLAFSTQPKGLLMGTTIVLVHGAFAESVSWDGVIEPLVAQGHPVVAASNPLRGLAADAASVSDSVPRSRGRSSSSPTPTAAQDVPAWFLIGEEDRVIPTGLQRYMAHRAGSQRTTVIEGARSIGTGEGDSEDTSER